MWEDLGFRAPDNIIIPTGAGSNILGCDLGFSELLRTGEIKRLPRLFCAQPLLCSPIATEVLPTLTLALTLALTLTLALALTLTPCSPIATEVLRALGADDGKTAPAEWSVP